MEVFQAVAAVAGVLALLLATLWWLGRRGLAVRMPLKRPSERRLESLERLPLGPNQMLHLVRVDGATLLVAATPAGCACLLNLGAETQRRGEHG